MHALTSWPHAQISFLASSWRPNIGLTCQKREMGMQASAPAYAADHPPVGVSQRRRAIIATVIGKGLEWFDFTVYSFFAVIIAKLFFPTGDDLSSLLLAVATFGVGFFMAPVGGIILGIYADRVGRKAALSAEPSC